MPRTHARVFCSIWTDPIFISLTPAAQRAYLLILSQPNVSLCGVVPWTPRRWASFSPDTKADDIEEAGDELERAGLVLIDHTTEELWIRGFVKNDTNILANKKLRAGLVAALSTVISPILTAAYYEKYGIPETENDLRNANPEMESEPKSISGFSSSSSGTRSSSSSALESVVLEREVEARLRRRRGDPINNLDAWKRKTRAELLDEWGDEGLAQKVGEEQERLACAACALCDDFGRVELIDGVISRCAHPDVKRAG